MTVQFHDPRAEPLAPAEPYRLRSDLGRGSTIGLLANGFPDSDTFLEQVEAVLEPRLPGVEFRHYNKRDASVRVREDMLERIVAQCTVVLAAYGH